jgi:hypothetical protein
MPKENYSNSGYAWPITEFAETSTSDRTFNAVITQEEKLRDAKNQCSLDIQDACS